MPLLQEKSFTTRLGRIGWGGSIVGGALVIGCAYAPAAWWLMVVGSLVLSAGVVCLWIDGEIHLRTVLLGAIAARVLLFPLAPSLSDDAYRYLWDGLLQHRGINPYLFVPSDPGLASLHEGWLYPLLNSADYFTVYPPVSQFVFWFGGLFHRPESLSSFYAVKAVVAACDLVILYLLARRVSASNLLLYAWHPLILLEFAGQGHQEAIMLMFLMLTWWLYTNDRGRLAVAALTFAVWVKLYPVVLMPFLLRRTRWSHLWISLGLSVLVWLPYAAPGVVGHLVDSLRLYVELFEFNAGPYYGAKYLMYTFTGDDWSKTLGPSFAAAYAAFWIGSFAVDARVRWRWPLLVVVLLGGYLALSTTVHPWYLTGLIGFIPLLQKKNLKHCQTSWYWLGTWSVGTYLFYQSGVYWPFVWIGWLGWAVLLSWPYWRSALDRVLKQRAVRKWNQLSRYVDATAGRVLDLGAGEGYVGKEAQNDISGTVTGVDVLSANRTNLSYHVYDGCRLPFGEDAFDSTIIVYVLHHAATPDRLLDEAVRVTRGRVVILESVYETRLDRWVLTALDYAVNSLRFMGSHGSIGRIRLRTAEEWQEMLEERGKVTHTVRLGGFPHKQALFVLEGREKGRPENPGGIETAASADGEKRDAREACRRT